MGTRINKKEKHTKISKFGTTSRINHDSSEFYNSSLYSGLINCNNNDKKENEFPAELLDMFIYGSSENMQDVPSNSLHLMITSPPYNVSKEYDEDLSLNEYLKLLQKVFAETYRVLVNGGRACINVANIGRKPYIPLSDHVSRIMNIDFHGNKPSVIYE